MVNVGVGTVQEELGRERIIIRICFYGMSALHRSGCGEGPAAPAATLLLDINDNIYIPPVDFAGEISWAIVACGGNEVEIDDGQLLQLLEQVAGILQA